MKSETRRERQDKGGNKKKRKHENKKRHSFTSFRIRSSHGACVVGMWNRSVCEQCDYLLGGLIVDFANAIVTPVRKEAACKEQVFLFKEWSVVVL